jgi:hypothetical protein
MLDLAAEYFSSLAFMQNDPRVKEKLGLFAGKMYSLVPRFWLKESVNMLLWLMITVSGNLAFL